MENTEVMQSKQYDPAEGMPGSTVKIREVMEKIESDVTCIALDEWLQKLLKVLNKKDKKEIIQAVLEKFHNTEELKPYQAELIKMQRHLERTGKKMVILFDGRDASGKGGTIRRVTRYMNEKRYHVVALGKPNEIQKTELHIKRYIQHFPYAGEIGLFDRSWYNRALVEPVMGFCTQKQYNRFLKKVNTYEQNFIEDDGRTLLIKLYFSVSKEEQGRRFDRRKNDPLRQWKLSEVDLQAQGVFVLLTLLILAPLFADLPEAVLGAIVIQAVVTGLMDVKAMKRVYRLNRTEFWVGMVALLGVLTFGTLQGVVIGLLLSLLVLIARSAEPNIPVLGRSPGTDIFHSLNQYPDSEIYPGLVIIRFDGPLYFATTNALRDKVRTVTTDVAPPVTKVLIDMEGVNYLDLEGSDMLNEIASNMKGAGVEIHLARVKHEVLEMLKKDGVDQIIGRGHIYNKIFEAVELLTQKERPNAENDQ